jgi:NET1-associated nuclear protein 1 (U3 small nucleolar RNA-associated protein 17)
MDWREYKTTGGYLNKVPILFSNDSRYFFCCCGCVVKVISVATGDTYKVLRAHTDLVTGVANNPNNHLQVYTFSLDGTFRLWDYTEPIVLQTWNVSVPIKYFALNLHTKKGKLYFYTYGRKKRRYKEVNEQMNVENDTEGRENKRDSNTFSTQNTENKENRHDGSDTHGIYQFSVSTRRLKLISSKTVDGLQLSHDGSFLAAWANKEFHIYNTKEKLWVSYKCNLSITCLAFHPQLSFVATGHDNGMIKFWHCFTLATQFNNSGATKDDNERPVVEPKSLKQQHNTMIVSNHWHHERLHALTFDHDGYYMYSGGKEMVLVIWQLETGTREYIPRIGAPILHIVLSPDTILWALQCQDNAIRLVNTRSRRLDLAVEGIKADKIKTGLLVEPRSKQIVLNGGNGSLQFYDSLKDRHITSLQVSIPNAVREFNRVRIPEIRVTAARFSPQGTWLVTAERRRDTDDIALKFWSFDHRSQQYLLNTRVNTPHTHPITSLAYNPTEDMCVTTSFDGTFKIWVPQLREIQPSMNSKHTREKPEYEWVCRSTGFYKNSREGVPLPARSCDFSHDGSLLAVSFQQIVTLWSPKTNGMMYVLAYPPPSEEIRGVRFITMSSLLVAWSRTRLFVWDLLSLSLWWSFELNVTHLAVHPTRPHFVVFSKNTKQSQKKSDKSSAKATAPGGYLILFNANHPKPLCYWKIRGIVKGVCFLPFKNDQILSNLTENKTSHSEKSQSDDHMIVYLNAFQEFKFLKEMTTAEYIALKKRRNVDAEEDNETKLFGYSSFTQIYGKLDALRIDDGTKSNQQTSAVSKMTTTITPTSSTSISTAAITTNATATSTTGDVSTDSGTSSETKGPKLLSHLPLIRSQTTTKLAQFFEGPSHTLPAPSSSYWTLMEMIIPKTNVTETNSEETQKEETSNVVKPQQSQQTLAFSHVPQNEKVIIATMRTENVDNDDVVNYSEFENIFKQQHQSRGSIISKFVVKPQFFDCLLCRI